jgi:hypothetical protein
MKPTATADSRTSEIAIFARVLSRSQDDLTPELARYLLTLGFGEEDQARMHDLAVRNQDGALSPQEWEELQNYVKAGCLLALLHSQARMSLKQRKVS